jgi:hypothetical protein
MKFHRQKKLTQISLPSHLYFPDDYLRSRAMIAASDSRFEPSVADCRKHLSLPALGLKMSARAPLLNANHMTP